MKALEILLLIALPMAWGLGAEAALDWLARLRAARRRRQRGDGS